MLVEFWLFLHPTTAQTTIAQSKFAHWCSELRCLHFFIQKQKQCTCARQKTRIEHGGTLWRDRCDTRLLNRHRASVWVCLPSPAACAPRSLSGAYRWQHSALSRSKWISQSASASASATTEHKFHSHSDWETQQQTTLILIMPDILTLLLLLQLQRSRCVHCACALRPLRMQIKTAQADLNFHTAPASCSTIATHAHANKKFLHTTYRERDTRKAVPFRFVPTWHCCNEQPVLSTIY